MSFVLVCVFCKSHVDQFYTTSPDIDDDDDDECEARFLIKVHRDDCVCVEIYFITEIILQNNFSRTLIQIAASSLGRLPTDGEERSWKRMLLKEEKKRTKKERNKNKVNCNTLN